MCCPAPPPPLKLSFICIPRSLLSFSHISTLNSQDDSMNSAVSPVFTNKETETGVTSPGDPPVRRWWTSDENPGLRDSTAEASTSHLWGGAWRRSCERSATLGPVKRVALTGGGVRTSGSATCQLWRRAVPGGPWAALSSLGRIPHTTDSTSQLHSFEPLKLVRKACGSKIWVLRVTGLETSLPLLKNCCWWEDVRSHFWAGSEKCPRRTLQLRADAWTLTLPKGCRPERSYAPACQSQSRQPFCNRSP